MRRLELAGRYDDMCTEKCAYASKKEGGKNEWEGVDEWKKKFEFWPWACDVDSCARRGVRDVVGEGIG